MRFSLYNPYIRAIKGNYFSEMRTEITFYQKFAIVALEWCIMGPGERPGSLVASGRRGRPKGASKSTTRSHNWHFRLFSGIFFSGYYERWGRDLSFLEVWRQMANYYQTCGLLKSATAACRPMRMACSNMHMACSNMPCACSNMPCAWGGRQPWQTSKVHKSGNNWPFVSRLREMKDLDPIFHNIH